MNSDETEPDMSALFNDFRSRKGLLSASGRMWGNNPGNHSTRTGTGPANPSRPAPPDSCPNLHRRVQSALTGSVVRASSAATQGETPPPTEVEPGRLGHAHGAHVVAGRAHELADDMNDIP